MRDDWQLLLLRLHGPHPLLDADFVNGLLQHFPVPNLYVASWLANGHLRGMLLLQRIQIGTGQWRSYLPSQAQIGLYLLPFEAPLSQLFAQLPGHAGQIDLLCNDAAFGDLRGPHDPSRFTQAHALTMSVDLQGGSDAYWASRTPKLLSNLRRYERKALAYCPEQSWMSHRRERGGLVAYDPLNPRGLLLWLAHLLTVQIKHRLSAKWLFRLRGDSPVSDTVTD